MRLFYDHLIDKKKLLKLVHQEAKTDKERKKFLETLDEMVHHTVLDVILVHLDEKHHEELLAMLHKTPYSEEILVYIKQKGHPEIEEKIKKEAKKLTVDILEELEND